MKWWQRWPWALEMEEAALQSHGLPYFIDEGQRAQGRLVIRVTVLVAGEQRELTATYPDSFPYFAPAVHMGGARFERHHNLEGFLCVLAHEAEEWMPGVDTLAGLLDTQLRRIVDANAQGLSAEDRRPLEEGAGEPLTNFLPYLPAPEVLLLPDGVPDDRFAAGTLEVAVDANAFRKNLMVGEIRAFNDAAARPLVKSAMLNPAFSHAMRGFWVRLESRPQIGAVMKGNELKLFFWNKIAGRSDALSNAIRAAKKGDTFVGAAVYQDEVSWDARVDDVVLMRAIVTVEQTKRNPAQCEVEFVRADAAGEKTYLQRAPFLAPLRTKSVMLVGAGNVGSPVAMQLARAAVKELVIVDPDVLQVGNTVRWALGRSFAGQHKAVALAEAIRQNFPLTKATGYALRVGQPGLSTDDQNEYDEFIRNQVAKADLVIDGSVHYGVNRFLSEVCRSLGKPYLWLSTTPGAAGGVVGRIVPGKSQGCWHCFQRALGDGRLPLPADVGDEGTQPAGCAHPTFIGAGVDSDEIAVLASRLAIATLCRGVEGGYPDFEWDVAICDLQTKGVPHAPRWSEHTLTFHPGCEKCGKHQ